MKVYFNSAAGEIAPVIIDGDPTADLSTQLAAANAAIAQFKTFRDVVVADAQSRKTADAATTEGQNLIDAAAGLP